MNNPSTLQPPWRYSYPFHDSQQSQLNNSSSNINDDSSESPQAWPAPSAAAMEERWRHRNNILEETKNHLLLHPHKGMSDTGRNIALVLYDRERRGSNSVTSLAHWQRSRLIATDDYSPSPSATIAALSCSSKIGDRSPSTVLESPLQRTASAGTPAMDASVLPRAAAAGSLMDSSCPTLRSIRNDTAGVGVGSVDCTGASSKKLSIRRVTYPLTISREIRTFGEYCSATKYHSAFLTHLGGDDVLDAEGNRPPSSRAVSTISVAFSPDGHTMASTHGDHTVKLSCCATGRLLQSLDGHPRTPWTVKYHPTDSRILASGCLGHQVRVWNWETKTCLQMIRLEFAIISLSFHPTGTVLAIANGTRLHFWGIDDCAPADTSSNKFQWQQQQQHRPFREHLAHQQRPPPFNNTRSARLTEMDQQHMLRCVHFPPDGRTLIIGGVNPMIQEDARRRRGSVNNGGVGGNGGMSFYLRLWDFDADKALETTAEHDATVAASPIGIPIPRRAISNARTFVPRALLYNDGGFDVSPDGKTLCACAEYWLPDGVDNAMELLHKEEMAFAAEMRVIEASLPCDEAQTDSLAETHSTVSAALAGLMSITEANTASHGRSRSFREGMERSAFQAPAAVLETPVASPEGHAHPSESAQASGFVPRTPPVSTELRLQNLSPPPPPGSRFIGRGIMRTREAVSTYGGQPLPNQPHAMCASGNHAPRSSGSEISRGMTTPLPPPPPPPPSAPGGMTMRPPHPLSVISVSSSLTNDMFSVKGRYVPHVVTVSLDTTPIPEEIWPRDCAIAHVTKQEAKARTKPPGAVARGYRPRLGQLLEACPLDANKASAVTCVKFSPSTDFCLIGYGVREPVVEGGGNFHPVTAVYRIRGSMDHVSTMLSGDDDVNIARFHPDSGHSFIYGTKQGRVRVLSPRPWNFYGDR